MAMDKTPVILLDFTTKYVNTIEKDLLLDIIEN